MAGGVQTLQADLHEHMHIENILFPSVTKLKAVSRCLQEIKHPDRPPFR
jgi:hypothetical protein